MRRTAIALRKPPLSSRLLQELAELQEPTVAQQFVAAYPLSPSHLLESLARTAQDPEVFPYLATNPRTPPHLLSEFAVHENPEVRAHVATHPQLAARELLNLAQDADANVRRSVATNASLRLPHHATLAIDANPGVRLRLAAQPALPSQVALILAADASTVVRARTLAAAPADEALLLGWAASDEEDIQLALATRADLPPAVVALLQLSSHATVRRAARELAKPDAVALLHFITIGDATEHAWVAGRPALPSPLQRQLAQTENPATHLILAANPSLDPDIADYFISLADPAICAALATNPTLTPDQIQNLAATRHPSVLTALAYRDDLYAELIPFLLEHSPDFLRHWAIQQKPATLADPALARRLTADALPTIRALAVASHPWRRADLYDFSRDPAAAVRLATLRHPNSADDLLETLSRDSSPEVAAAALAQRTARAQAPKSSAREPAHPPVRHSVSSEPSPHPATAAASSRAARSDLSTLNSQLSTKLTQLKRLFWQ